VKVSNGWVGSLRTRAYEVVLLASAAEERPRSILRHAALQLLEPVRHDMQGLGEDGCGRSIRKRRPCLFIALPDADALRASTRGARGKPTRLRIVRLYVAPARSASRTIPFRSPGDRDPEVLPPHDATLDGRPSSGDAPHESTRGPALHPHGGAAGRASRRPVSRCSSCCSKARCDASSTSWLTGVSAGSHTSATSSCSSPHGRRTSSRERCGGRPCCAPRCPAHRMRPPRAHRRKVHFPIGKRKGREGLAIACHPSEPPPCEVTRGWRVTIDVNRPNQCADT
jgi:hypothetical protein